MKIAILCVILAWFAGLSLGAANDYSRQYLVVEYYDALPCSTNNLDTVLAYPVGHCRNISGSYSSYYVVDGVLHYKIGCKDPQCQQSCYTGVESVYQCKATNTRQGFQDHAADLMKANNNNNNRKRATSAWNYRSSYLSNGLPEYAANGQVYMAFASNISCDLNNVDFFSVDLACDLVTDCRYSQDGNYQFICGFPPFVGGSSSPSSSFPSSSSSSASTGGNSLTTSVVSSTTATSLTPAPLPYIINVTIFIKFHGDVTTINLVVLQNAFQLTLSTSDITLRFVYSTGTKREDTSFGVEAKASYILPATTPQSSLSQYNSASITSSVQGALADSSSPIGAATVGLTVESVTANSVLSQSPSTGSASNTGVTPGITTSSSSSVVVSTTLLFIFMLYITL